MTTKEQVRDFWNEASCGEDLYLEGFSVDDYMAHSQTRYKLEPEILEIGEFHKFAGLKTLEIGVGLGADHQLLAEAGADLYGVDLTERAIGHTQRRFDLLGLHSELQVADAENLPFEDESFDAIYSWGVLHHTPDMRRALSEVYRVLKPGGFAKILMYHKYSVVGLMLWVRFGLLRIRPFISLDQLYSEYLESPGTKAFSVKETHELFDAFEVNSIRTPLSHGDLLSSDVGQRHRGILLSTARLLWPRAFIRWAFPNNGLWLHVDCLKPTLHASQSEYS